MNPTPPDRPNRHYPSTTVMTVRVPVALAEWLRREAEAQHRTLGGQLALILEKERENSKQGA